ncbi:uncharacterized protein LOC142163043 [Nicotiana tabacum]|uniref:Uncharacterized protein LOC142163043 n=1 Tax=Nicotiana tabacum TaxID=4097 RepID=A0AC58RUK4_TOBAC
MAETGSFPIDHNHPLLLAATDTPGVALHDIKLTGPENYGLWSRSMRMAVLVKSKLGFIEGTCLKSSYKGELANRWERCNTQGTNSVTSYYTKMKDLWDEIDLLVPAPGCDCEETRPFIEKFKNLHLLQFLVGVNESYSQVRSQILLKMPVLTVNQAYALVIQEESQRELSVLEVNMGPLAMMAEQNQRYKGKKIGIVCEYCGYKGHLKENYYKIIGYPPDFKSKKKQQGQGNRTYANMMTEETTSSSQGQQMGQLFNEDQYKQILELLNKTPAGDCHTLMGLHNEKVMGIGGENYGLYILKWRDKPVVALDTKDTDECSLCHMRLGHPSIIAMKHISVLKNKVVDSLQHNCESSYEVVTVLKDFLIMVKTQFDMNVKQLTKRRQVCKERRKISHHRLLRSSKGYRLFDLETKTIFVSRDVSFREHIFPFKENVTIPQDSFPTQASIPSHPDPSFLTSTDPHIPPTDNVLVIENTNIHTTEVLQLDHTAQNTEVAEVEHDEQNTYIDLVPNTEPELDVSSDNRIPVSRNDQEPRKTTRTSKPPEIQALEDNRTWEIVGLPAWKQAIGSKGVYKIKYKANGEIERYKSRLVAKGYNKKEGLDYHETFSPVANMVSIRTIISIAAAKGWPLSQLDVSNAFLQGDLYEEVYMQLPQGFHKQGELKSGYKQSLFDHSLFTKQQGGEIVIILVYIDDLIITGSSSNLVNDDTTILHSNSLISWKSKKQPTVRRSSPEAEYRSMTAATAKITWLTRLLEDLGIKVSRPVTLFCDNKTAIQIAGNPIFHERTKHIEIDCHFVREKIKTGLITPCHVFSSLQLADLLTKGLTAAQHSCLMSKLDVWKALDFELSGVVQCHSSI